MRFLLFLRTLKIQVKTNNKKHIMKRFGILFLLIPMMVLFTSCKQSQIKKLEKFTAEVSTQYDGYSNSDLEKAQVRFEKLLANVERPN